ncbi:MAG: peptidylprolyl isomerase [Sphingopyxis sp.]|nr:peptidylprolyl isomerase [Sphingopyxis sp.]
MIFKTLILSLAMTATAAAQPPMTGSPPPPPPPLPVPQSDSAPDTRPYVALVTDAGTIVVRLENKRAPVTTANFLRYVDSKRMDGFTFYRTSRSWGPDSKIIQGGNRGDPRKNYPPIAHEPTNVTGLTSCKGALAMARLAPGDATTDFFLLLSAIPGFDADPAISGDNAGFAVFGEMVSGAEVAEKIYAAPVSETAGEGPMKGQMLTPPFKIVSARRVPAPADAPKGCAVKAP